MHQYETTLKKAGSKLESAMKKRGFAAFGIDWITFVMDLISKLLDCGAEGIKEAVEGSPRWTKAVITLSLQRHAERRIPLFTLRAMADAVLEEAQAAPDDELKSLVGD